ncbi:glycoside hydrolase family 16 protein [Gelatoporia subvermispora B]|uniref:Glycoside hydrolase family 16 protein n=1 Tax=Ceriporiopsis subvermispora (strain B) TaxID=914234 RepID=M2RDV8_CERS8|nr:glycoside hydrolase family 16 protein [Gelatoporia subvermispora B]
MSAAWSGESSGSGSAGSGEHRSGASTPEDASDSPRQPNTPTVDQPLLPADANDSTLSPKTSRSFSAANFVSSPLNPNTSPHVLRSRPASRGSTQFNRIASEESQALAAQQTGGPRGSMLLYRLALDDNQDQLAPPPPLNNRDSVASSSGDSVFSLSSDSKYPSGVVPIQRGFVPYVYDPDLDTKEGPDDDDDLYLPEYPDPRGRFWSWRGILNIGVLALLVSILLALFVAYPVVDFWRNNTRNLAIDNNGPVVTSNSRAAPFQIPQLIDAKTPESAKQRTGWDNEQYELVFSDEFETDGRTFWPGDDPFWEAVNIWYGTTEDLEWYDPSQIFTTNGSLQIRMDQVADPSTNHGLQYKSGMLQSWNKFCFTSGYIEVSITLPGPNSNTRGYWPGAWTMGNLGRPGYAATTDGTWPYSYGACDVGTFPNQTFQNGSGPAAALHSDASRSKYNFDLSWLPGQRVSSCTCPGEDHPGPDVSVGRGAPEIDILEVERNKTAGSVGQVVSQSAQFAPFTADYQYGNATEDEWWVYTPDITRPNTYKGSAIQQAISCLTDLPDDMFQGSGQVFTTLGFEYFSDPKDPTTGFITWQSNGQPSYRLGAGSVGPDQGPDGSQVSQRLIPVEPMSIILNLGMSESWQTIDLSTMEFPAIMQVDYVRVYQRSDSQNVGCDPPDYPTMDYINNHMEAYTNPNLTFWSQPPPVGAGYPWPKNSQLTSC